MSRVAVASAAANPPSSYPSRSARVPASPFGACRARSKDSLARACDASEASMISSIVQPIRLASLARGGVASEVVGELLALALDADRALLQVAGQAHAPGDVAKVAPDLTLHRRHGERAEGGTVIGVIALQRLQQAHRRDLLEVVERHPAATVKAPRDRVGERQVCTDQPLASFMVTVIGVGTKSGCSRRRSVWRRAARRLGERNSRTGMRTSDRSPVDLVATSESRAVADSVQGCVKACFPPRSARASDRDGLGIPGVTRRPPHVRLHTSDELRGRVDDARTGRAAGSFADRDAKAAAKQATVAASLHTAWECRARHGLTGSAARR